MPNSLVLITSRVLIFCSLYCWLVSLTFAGVEDNRLFLSDYRWRYLPYFDGVVSNPGVGFVDFHDSYGKSKISGDNSLGPMLLYYRWTWAELNPAPGVYNFSNIDVALSRAKKEGKSVAFRIMTVTHKGTPEWVYESGVPFVDYDPSRGDKFPDHNSLNYMEFHLKFLRALNAHIDRERNIEFLDIGSVGCWGEWHAYCCPQNFLDACKNFMPTTRSELFFINSYREIFKNIRLVGLIAAPVDVFHEYKIGWRADCLGDLGFFSETSNLMLDRYTPLAASPALASVWRSSPVVFETCFTLRDWLVRGFDVDFILNQALLWHASSVNILGNDVPFSLHNKIVSFGKRLGYRLFFSEYYFPELLDRFDFNFICFNIRNLGVAPPYRDFYLNFKFVDNSTGYTYNSPSKLVEFDRGRFMPGDDYFCENFPLTRHMEFGYYSIFFSISSAKPNEPLIKLANLGGVDGWYRVGSFYAY